MLAFLSSTTSFVSVPTLAVMPINGNANDIITIPFDRDKTNITWSDDKYLYFTSQSNGGTILNRVNIKTKKVEALSSSDIGVSSFDLANNTRLC
jgi:dipeptidyl aminopeptidase/acylaminoacyl peptidase